MADFPFASPNCFVDIYPFEGGTYTLKSSDVLSVTTTKSITEDAGTFRIILAPAIAGRLSWSQIISPLSLTVIGLQRGDKRAVVMVGVVTRVGETQIWDTNGTVTRSIVIEGQDFGYFFALPDYLSLWYLAARGEIAVELIGSGLQSLNPGQIGQAWFDTVMTQPGVFGSTTFQYDSGPVTFPEAMGTLFEKYDVTIPITDYFLGANNSWYEKFRAIFTMPFYEFFIATDYGLYGENAGATRFQSKGLTPDIKASPAVIARINPLPTLVTSVNDGATSFDSIDVSRWDALPKFDLGAIGFIESNIVFSENLVSNVYILNPTWLSGLLGADNNNIVQPLYLFGGAADFASINRYGYRPQVLSTLWFSQMGNDGGGNNANANPNFAQTYATMTGRLAAFYEPLALMARSTVRTVLRPDIEIGNRFTYKPFRMAPTQDQLDWDFYIEGVSHTFQFGGESSTTLTLGRGLPSSVYADSGAGGLLFNVHIGNAQRFQGTYISGLPKGSAQPLTAITPEKFADQIQQLNRIYITPQAVAPTP